MDMFSNLRRVAVLGMLAAVAASPIVAAAQAAPDATRKPFVTPELRKQMVHAEHLRAAARASTDGRAIDTTPPTVVAFNAAATSISARNPTAYVPVKVEITDDLSGVNYYNIYAQSPSGQLVDVYWQANYPLDDATATVQVRVTPYAEPGTWQIVQIYAYDFAGNEVYLDQPALAALGNTTFTVTNSSYDLVPPTLVKGRILTPTISASRPATGVPANTYSQFAGATMQVADTGNTATSGVDYAQLAFCLPDGFGGCTAFFFLSSAYVNPIVGPTSTTLTIGESSYDGSNVLPVGTYQIYDAYVGDIAGNYTSYLSTLFGGSTDFTTLFPTTTITVTR